MRRIPSKSKAPVLVQTKEAGTYMVEATPMENNRNRLNVAKEVVETLLHQQFSVTKANTPDVLINLDKNMKV